MFELILCCLRFRTTLISPTVFVLIVLLHAQSDWSTILIYNQLQSCSMQPNPWKLRHLHKQVVSVGNNKPTGNTRLQGWKVTFQSVSRLSIVQSLQYFHRHFSWIEFLKLVIFGSNTIKQGSKDQELKQLNRPGKPVVQQCPPSLRGLNSDSCFPDEYCSGLELNREHT